MTNVCMKFGKVGPNQTLVIDWRRLYTMDGPTTNGPTGCVTFKLTNLDEKEKNVLDNGW